MSLIEKDFMRCALMIGATVVGIAIASGAHAEAGNGNYVDGDESWQRVFSPSSTSDQGQGQSLLNEGDNVDVAPSVSFHEGNMPDLMPMLDECTVTDMVTVKAFLFGYSESVGVLTPRCKYELIPQLAGEWLTTPEPGSSPFVKIMTPHGVKVKFYTQEEMFRAAMGRAFLKTDFADQLDAMNIR